MPSLETQRPARNPEGEQNPGINVQQSAQTQPPKQQTETVDIFNRFGEEDMAPAAAPAIPSLSVRSLFNFAINLRLRGL